MDIKLIRAFIASPGGLEDERKAAFAAAEEVNRSVARPLGGRLELIGWEETLSGHGRPQQIINADMETCDLFIGAIWTSWGSRPSLDGPYTSGFEEEFELSRKRHAETSSPIMAMFFKSVDPGQMRDPGAELQKVLAFQEKLKAEKTFLYGTFGGADDFAARVREFLSHHVIQLLRQSAAPREERPIEIARKSESTDQSAIAANDEVAPDADFLFETSATVRRNDTLTATEVARLRLIATSAGLSNNDKQLIGVHDANLIYSGRGSFDLSFAERRGLLEAGLSAIAQENMPVWSWLANITGKETDLLMSLTVFGDPAERSGAIEAMRRLQAPIEQLSFLKEEAVGNYWLGETTDSEIKVAALRYLRDLGTPHELPLVQQEVERAASKTLAAALEAAVAIRLRQGDKEAAEYLIGTSYEKIDERLQSRALQQVGQLPMQMLRNGLDHRSPEVRAAVVRELSERGAIDLETLDRAKSDESAKVRLSALRALERLGQGLSLDEAYKVLSHSRSPLAGYNFLASIDSSGAALFEEYRSERLRSLPAATLETLLSTPTHRDAAYQALAARRIGDFGTRLRADLRDGFESYFALHWPEGIKAPPETAASLLSIGRRTDPEVAKKRDLTRAALEIVAAQRDAADLALVREILDHSVVPTTMPVIAFLKTLGDARDIVRLSEAPMITVPHDDGDIQAEFTEAARVILRLSKDLSELLALDLPTHMLALLIESMPANEFAKLTDDAIIALLLSEKDHVRRAVARKIPVSVGRARVERLLRAYRNEPEGRYYIVTYWLDLGIGYDRPTTRRVVGATQRAWL